MGLNSLEPLLPCILAVQPENYAFATIFHNLMSTLRTFVALASLGIALCVSLWPGVVYSPVPKVALFSLLSLLPAILFGGRSRTAISGEAASICFLTIGAAALCLGTLLLLNTSLSQRNRLRFFTSSTKAGNRLIT